MGFDSCDNPLAAFEVVRFGKPGEKRQPSLRLHLAPASPGFTSWSQCLALSGCCRTLHAMWGRGNTSPRICLLPAVTVAWHDPRPRFGCQGQAAFSGCGCAGRSSGTPFCRQMQDPEPREFRYGVLSGRLRRRNNEKQFKEDCEKRLTLSGSVTKWYLPPGIQIFYILKGRPQSDAGLWCA